MYSDDVPEDIKKRRNNELLAIQNAISEEDNQPKIGRQYEVLVEGPSKSAMKADRDGPTLQLTGRTMWDHIVVFEGTSRQIGQILPVTIYDANAFTLFGEIVTEHVGPDVFTLSS